MKLSSVLLPIRVVLAACGLVAAVPLEDSSTPEKIVTFFSQEGYTGLNYTLLDNKLDTCVNFTQRALVVNSVKVFHDTRCLLFDKQGCDSYPYVVYEDTPVVLRQVNLRSVRCATVDV